MRKGFLGSIPAALLASSLAVAQTPSDAPTTLPASGSPPPTAITSGQDAVCQAPAWCCDEEPCATSRFWFGGEYLLWWVKNGPNPVPLATTSTDLAAATAGGAGLVGTSGLLGPSRLDYKTFSGLRFDAGAWLDADQCLGLEASGFLLETRPVRQGVRSDATGNPALFVPVRDVTAGEEGLAVALPGELAGGIAVNSSSRLWGAEVNALAGLYRDDNVRLALLAGFRFASLDEGIDLRTTTTTLADDALPSPVNPGTTVPAGTTVATTDSFRARNQFYGGQVGARAEYGLGSGLYLDVRATVALGCTHQIIDVGGVTTQALPGTGAVAVPGGLLATAGNSGHFDHNRFSVLPQGSVRIGYRATQNLCGFVGYDFLYWSDVVRPGNQIGHSVDERSIPSSFFFVPGFRAAVPPPSFSHSDFWAQGLTFGLELSF